MKQLPKPEHEYGYPKDQIKRILDQLNIEEKDFNEVFGINTVTMDKNGDAVLYSCDVEKALFKLGHTLGKWHPLD